MTRINNYAFARPLSCENSGFSKWGIGCRGGERYFVKEFLSPVYPADDSMFTEEKKQARIQHCNAFVREKRKLYSALREAAEGHIVTAEQFFRVGAKYYMSTKAVTEPVLSIQEIAKYAYVERLHLCCEIAHAMAKVHGKGIVHADIKHDNVLVIRKGGLRANIIDFDCSFFEENCPELGEELNGDLVYLSPEGFLHIAEIESNLSCKMDVFALGILFCQYFTGEAPYFDTEEYQYAYECVLDDQELGLDGITDANIRYLLHDMLKKAPEDRPDMETVFQTLNAILLRTLNRNAPEWEPDSWFKRAGDL